jgi:hypothetical protein
VEIDYLSFAEHFAFVVGEVLLVTLRVAATFADADVATFVVEDSFEVTIVEMEPYIEGYYHAVVVEWQVLVLNWVNMLVLEAAPLLLNQLADLHNLASCCDSFDEALALNCVLVGSDDSVDSIAVCSYSIDVEVHQLNVTWTMQHVALAMSNEIVDFELAVAAEYHVLTLIQVAEQLDSLTDAATDVIVVVAAAVAAVDDFEPIDLSGIVSAE